MRCDLCHEIKEGLTWLGSPEGRLLACSECLKELVAFQEAESEEPATEQGIA